MPSDLSCHQRIRFSHLNDLYSRSMLGENVSVLVGKQSHSILENTAQISLAADHHVSSACSY